MLVALLRMILVSIEKDVGSFIKDDSSVNIEGCW